MNIDRSTRGYRQGARAEAAQERTERILAAALELFVETPFDQITLAAIARRADVGLQTLIRRVGTKDGLGLMVNEWVGPQIAADRGEPTSADPDQVAATFARVYERWGAVIDRSQRQEDTSPALAAGAEAGRRSHREWIAAAFAAPLARLSEPERRRVAAQLVGVCGAEMWRVLRRNESLTPEEATTAVADLIRAALGTATTREKRAR
jgi:AcrR family transcriptional regulator